MSFRDLRNFTEMMRALGYTRIISMENFRSPNFPLVAEIMIWLIRRFDPDADIPTEHGTEQDRVTLVRSVAQFMASKAHIKLNTKKLYQADGYAVRELLKVTTVLYDALRVNLSEMGEEGVTLSSHVDFMPKVSDLKQTRLLASQITERGATLYDLLSKEVEMRETRNSCMNRQLEMEELEKSIKEALAKTNIEIANTKQLIENVSANEQSLDSKIEKKKLELERNKNRLLTLKKVRPAFLEEFERLEAELQQLYQEYLLRFRCQVYLEQQLEDAERVEQERMADRQAAAKRFLEQLKQEDRMAEGPGDLFVGSELKDELELGTKVVGAGKASRVRIKTASGVMRKASAVGQSQRRVFGSMAPMDDDDDSGSLDSDSDLLLDEDGSELLGTDDEEDELELAGTAASKGGDKRSSNHSRLGQSDDDF